MSTAFEKLTTETDPKPSYTNPLEDFLKSHPHLELRIEKFRSQAKLWIDNFPNEKRYIGKKNFNDRRTAFEENYPEDF